MKETKVHCICQKEDFISTKGRFFWALRGSLLTLSGKTQKPYASWDLATQRGGP